MKRSVLFTLFSVFFGFLFACKEKEFRHDETVYVASMDTTIEVKISYPDKWSKNDKIIIWSDPPLSHKFTTDFDSIVSKRDIALYPLLRRKLLDAGYINIEYIGRNDSVLYMNRKYSASDSNTKATDLESLIHYIKSIKGLKKKKIILIGVSEGGTINIKVASKRQRDIAALVQLSCGSISGKNFVAYQNENIHFFNFLVRHFDSDFFDKTVNKVSTLDSYHTADIDGVIQFFKENVEPIEDFIYKYCSMDPVYYHIDSYLRNRWRLEGVESKDFFKNDFNLYYKYFAGYITPQQITIRTVKFENFFPSIKCPVLAVNGTMDDHVDCYPNVERMEQLLNEGGNFNFDKIIVEGFNHGLLDWSRDNYLEENNLVLKIIDWINKQ